MIANEGLGIGEQIEFLITACPDIDSGLGGPYSYVHINLNPATESGVIAVDMFNVIYNQIWIIPVKIDAGLVTVTKYYDLFIWNAYVETAKTISNIVRQNLTDVYLASNLVGEQLTSLELIETDIIVDGSGVPVFNGYFDFTIGGEHYRVYVQGKRLLVVPVVHFLADNYRFIYQFEVAKAVNSVLAEQRRLIHPDCIRSIQGKVFIPDMSRNFAINIFDSLGGRIIGISIPHEKLTQVASNLQGLTNIYVNETITNYIELHNAKFLLAFREDNYRYECLLISAVDTANKKITLESAVLGDFPKSVTVLFPILVSNITSLSLEGKIGNYTVADMTAVEVFL